MRAGEALQWALTPKLKMVPTTWPPKPTPAKTVRPPFTHIATNTHDLRKYENNHKC